MIQEIVNARLPDRKGLWTLRCSGGRIASLLPQDDAQHPIRSDAEGRLDAGGGLLTPPLVDAHLHLDLAYSADQVAENRSGTLLEAIGHWTEAKRSLTVENVFERALRAIQEEASFGTGYIRSHVDVASASELRLVQGVLAAREATQSLCAIQLVAFPQDGLVRDPQAQHNLRESLRLGVDLVGGIPHIERTPQDGLRHLQLVFDLAEEFDRDIDVHIDETDDPSSRYTEQLAALTIERGWQGRVTASHACALSSYDDVHAARVIALLAEARVSVVTNPGVNLHLQGRFDTYPKRRGLTRVRELLAAGVRCAAGQDCIRDPFYPLGNGRMLDQAFLLVHADHLSTPALIERAFDMVCRMAGEITFGPGYGLHEGSEASAAVFPASDVRELVRLRPAPTIVLRQGECVAMR